MGKLQGNIYQNSGAYTFFSSKIVNFINGGKDLMSKMIKENTLATVPGHQTK